MVAILIEDLNYNNFIKLFMDGRKCMMFWYGHL